MNISELIKRNFVDKNLYMANRVSNVQVVETSNFVKVNSQLCSDTFNVGIILDEHRDYELLFKEVVGSFNEERNVMSLWCWEDSGGFQDFLVYKGMRRTEVNFGMYADVKTLDPKIGHVPGFQMFETIDIDAFCQVLSSVFDEEEGRNVREYYKSLNMPVIQGDAELKFYLGNFEGRPVCCGSTVKTSDSIGIYDIVTLKEMRGRGFGTEMFGFILKEIKANYTGTCVLQASEAGMGIYARAGFAKTCEIAIYDNRAFI